MELNKVLEKVRKLISVAEGTIPEDATPEIAEAMRREQDAARTQADAMMLKFAIDEATLDATRPAEARSLPSHIDIEIGRWMDDITGWIETLANDIARHTRCLIRHYAVRQDGKDLSRVYGYESDLRYFEVLYTTVRLHMLGVLMQKPDPTKSFEDNAYYLHNAGNNWLEIAGMYGWRKVGTYEAADLWPDIKIPYTNKDSGETKPATYVGGLFKRAYYSACKKRGEEPTKITAGGARTYRNSAAQGYVYMIDRRLRRVEGGREIGTDLILAGREENLAQYFRSENPSANEQCPKCEWWNRKILYICERCGEEVRPAPAPPVLKPGRLLKYREQPHNEAAYRRGGEHAMTADLGGHNVGNTKKELS